MHPLLSLALIALALVVLFDRVLRRPLWTRWLAAWHQGHLLVYWLALAAAGLVVVVVFGAEAPPEYLPDWLGATLAIVLPAFLVAATRRWLELHPKRPDQRRADADSREG